MADIKFGHGRVVEERQAVEVPERIRNVVVKSIDLANSIHWRVHLAIFDSTSALMTASRRLAGPEVGYFVIDTGGGKPFNASSIACDTMRAERSSRCTPSAQRSSLRFTVNDSHRSCSGTAA
jgi:hypothetical protein